MNLGPAGHSTGDSVAEVVVGNGLAELLDEDGPLGPRADEAHVAAEDVEELGQFVDVRPPKPAADPGAAVVAGRGPDGPGLPLGVDAHAPELEHAEQPAPLPDALLHVEDRPAGRDQDRDRDGQEQRREHDQPGQRREEVDRTLGRAIPPPGVRRADARERRRCGNERIAAGVGADPVNADVRLRDDLDLPPDPVRRAVRKRDDEVGCLEAVDPLLEPVDPADDGDGLGLGMHGELPASREWAREPRVAGVDEADDRQVGPGAQAKRAGDPPAVAAAAHDQDPAGRFTRGRSVAGFRGGHAHGERPPFRRCRRALPRAMARRRLPGGCERSDHPWRPLRVFP